MTVDTDPDAAYMAFRIEEDWLSDEVDPLLVSYVDRRINERRCYKDLDKNQFRFFRYSSQYPYNNHCCKRYNKLHIIHN